MPRRVPCSYSGRAPSLLALGYPSPRNRPPHCVHTQPARPALQRQLQRPRPRVRAPAPSRWLVPASARRRLYSPSLQHTSAAASVAGEGKAPGGRPMLPAVVGGAHAGLASPGPFPSRRPQGERARRVTLGGGSAAPFPSLAVPSPAGAPPPPVRLCGGLLDYVCPLRAPALASGWRWGGKKTRRRRRRRRWRGGGGSQQGHGS